MIKCKSIETGEIFFVDYNEFCNAFIKDIKLINKYKHCKTTAIVADIEIIDKDW